MNRTLPFLAPRYELRLVRRAHPDQTVVVRSRHHTRLLAEVSRRLDADHASLIGGCELVVVDRAERAAA